MEMIASRSVCGQCFRFIRSMYPIAISNVSKDSCSACVSQRVFGNVTFARSYHRHAPLRWHVSNLNFPNCDKNLCSLCIEMLWCLDLMFLSVYLIRAVFARTIPYRQQGMTFRLHHWWSVTYLQLVQVGSWMRQLSFSCLEVEIPISAHFFSPCKTQLSTW